MARLRKRTLETVGGTPAPLLDPSARQWHDEYQYEALLEQLHLHPLETSTEHVAACGERYRATLRAWSVANGLVDEQGSTDRAALTRLGIPHERARRHPTCPH